MSNARPPNVPPTTGPRETLVDWVWAPALAVVDESAVDTVVETVEDDGVDDGVDDKVDVDVAPAGMTRK